MKGTSYVYHLTVQDGLSESDLHVALNVKQTLFYNDYMEIQVHPPKLKILKTGLYDKLQNGWYL